MRITRFNWPLRTTRKLPSLENAQENHFLYLVWSDTREICKLRSFDVVLLHCHSSSQSLSAETHTRFAHRHTGPLFLSFLFFLLVAGRLSFYSYLHTPVDHERGPPLSTVQTLTTCDRQLNTRQPRTSLLGSQTRPSFLRPINGQRTWRIEIDRLPFVVERRERHGTRNREIFKMDTDTRSCRRQMTN